MEKILYITPHLSTGGLPQYLLNKIQHFILQHFKIYCVEWDDITGGELIIQKQEIENILEDKLITLSRNKEDIMHIINHIQPDYIHFEEIPETFISFDILKKIYSPERKYKILVTTHSSYTDFSTLRFLADRFVLVSEWSKNKCQKELPDVDCSIFEYNIQPSVIDKKKAIEKLGLDPNYKHVLHVGLFTPGKNQKAIVDLARICKNEKIIFHFVGNQAINFKEYWDPLMKDFPPNCLWWNEQNRETIEMFYQAADVFYFPSLFELNPLSLIEAKSYGLPIFLKKLETYGNKYDDETYITDNIEENKKLLLDKLNLIPKFKGIGGKSIVIITGHTNSVYRKHVLKECLEKLKNFPKLLCVNYPVDSEFQEKCEHYLYVKENPLLYKEDYHKYGINYHYWWIDENGNRQEKLMDFEHGYAHYILMKNALLYAESLGYNVAYFVNYDCLIEPETLLLQEEKLKVNSCFFFKYKNKSYEEESYSTGVFSGHISCLKPFFDYYKSLGDYYKDGQYMIERKVYDFYKNYVDLQTFNTFFSSLYYEDLPEFQNINKEGVLPFQKHKHIKNEFQFLGEECGTDKVTLHRYHEIYPLYLDKFRNKNITLFEIGIDEGSSYKLWEKYFPKAKIFGLDINKGYKTDKGEVFKGDQNDNNIVKEVSNKIGKCNIIIDDGSHIPEHQLKCFDYFFNNNLDWGGVYIIEDIETSYWRPEATCYGYEVGHLNVVDHFKNILHSINSNYNLEINYLNISSIIFGENCIIINKKEKEEHKKEYKFSYNL